MSKKSKNANALERKKKKAAQKQSMKLLYQTWARNGENSKSKRFTARGRRQHVVKTHAHDVFRCGNVGCKRCFAKLNGVVEVVPVAA